MGSFWQVSGSKEGEFLNLGVGLLPGVFVTHGRMPPLPRVELEPERAAFFGATFFGATFLTAFLGADFEEPPNMLTDARAGVTTDATGAVNALVKAMSEARSAKRMRDMTTLRR